MFLCDKLRYDKNILMFTTSFLKLSHVNYFNYFCNVKNIRTDTLIAKSELPP